jgi:glycerol-3-phosphate cytidylyltransferase
MTTGIIAGCYDLIHPGYIIGFSEAKRHCSKLIVALQDDPTTERPSKNKPVNTLCERYIVLDSIKYIDEIVVYNTEKEFENILNLVNPDVRFLGDDYKQKKKNEITGYFKCMNIVYLSRSHGYSTTKLKDKIVETHK